MKMRMEALFMGLAVCVTACNSTKDQFIALNIGLSDLIPDVPYAVTAGKWVGMNIFTDSDIVNRASGGMLVYHSVTKGHVDQYKTEEMQDDGSIQIKYNGRVLKDIQTITTYGILLH
jgi:hypothetical protein